MWLCERISFVESGRLWISLLLPLSFWSKASILETSQLYLLSHYSWFSLQANMNRIYFVSISYPFEMTQFILQQSSRCFFRSRFSCIDKGQYTEWSGVNEWKKNKKQKGLNLCGFSDSMRFESVHQIQRRHLHWTKINANFIPKCPDIRGKCAACVRQTGYISRCFVWNFWKCSTCTWSVRFNYIIVPVVWFD